MFNIEKKNVPEEIFHHKHLNIRESYDFDQLSCRYKPLLRSRALVTRNNGTDCDIFSEEIIVALFENSHETLVHISFLK